MHVLIGRRTSWRVSAALCLVLLVTACAGTGQLERARSQLRDGDPVAALDTLADVELPRRDQLLLYLDRGLAAHAAGRFRDSIAALDQADELIKSLDIVSVSEQGATLIVNDRAASYRGESAEHLWIRTFQMLNYLALGEAEGAAVEARRALVVLDEHGDTLAGDPVSRLLIAMSFEAAGQYDSASVEYRKLVTGAAPDGVLRAAWLNARRTARPDTATEIAARLSTDTLDDVQQEYAARDGELVIVLADGFVPRKRAGDLFVSIDLRVSFPYYERSYGTRTPDIDVVVDGRNARMTRVDTHLVDIARASLEERGKRLAVRHAARAAVKYNIAHQVSREDQLAGELVRLLLFVLEQADTRSWATLPATLTLAQVPLPPGNHDVELQVGVGGRQFRTRLENVAIRAGQRTFRSMRPSAAGPLQYGSNKN